jgi:N-acetylglutamate synthase-like GNAT family acetyltransferase
MIRRCDEGDLEKILKIINESAKAYKGVIPEDCLREPYMSLEELKYEIAGGVVFWGCEEGGELVGVMGIQKVRDVTLIRHAYVHPAMRNRGIGGKLLTVLRKKTERPILVGTWADAEWAIRFYEKHGFQLLSKEDTDRLLNEYWSIPKRQIETSVVLADHMWLKINES